MRLMHRSPAAHSVPVVDRLREGITWHAQREFASVRTFGELWHGFRQALDAARSLLAEHDASGAFRDEVGQEELITVRNGSVLLPNGNRVYACSSIHGEAWYSHVTVSEVEEANELSYARLELLFEFRGAALCLCRYLRPHTTFDTDGSQPHLPDDVWRSFATCLALPPRNAEWTIDEMPEWDILPVRMLHRPAVLLPVPVPNISNTLGNDNVVSYWLHAAWAMGILPEVTVDESDPVTATHLRDRLNELASAPPGALAAQPAVGQQAADEADDAGSDEEPNTLIDG
jgi:hypothetical protein